ncbi:cell division protein ZapA [Romboutsia sp. MSSM.1001216sp_RTP31141st1_G3_RTP31141_220114]|uniref:cell division protein ZapA n=1 Tax=unclassified Romboutsia TaxID=2626894 RepID=UPI0031B6450E
MNKVTVKIHGAEYPMVGEKSEKHMISVAAFVDTEMNKIGEANKRLSSSQVAILAAINITDELFDCADALEKVEKENEELKKKVGNSGEEYKLEIKELEYHLENKDKENKNHISKIEELNKLIEEQKKEIEQLKNGTNLSKQEVEDLKNEIKELKSSVEMAEEKANVAEQLSSKFQNDAYKLQLEKIEIENELKYLRAMK